MSLFLLIVLSIYGAMHGYLFWKVHQAWPNMGWWRLPAAGVCAAMIFAPVLVHLLERWRQFRLAGAAALVGYLWLAGIFWFCVLALAGDGWNLGVRLLSLAAPAARAAMLPPRGGLAGIGAIVAAALCWGWVQARDVRVKEVTVEVPGLAESLRPLRLVQVSDLHLGVHIGRDRLEKITALVRQARPDVLVCTGDLVDSSYRDLSTLAGALGDIRPALGKFAVLGNHEFYAGLPRSLAFHEAAGFRVLRAEAARVTADLAIAGVDDPSGGRTGQEDRTDENAALPAAGASRPFTVLLKHRPAVARASVGRFDLQLSGHTHGGQIFPFNLVVALIYRQSAGLHRVRDGSSIYVSRGTGTWGPPLRVLAPPEVTLITLRPAGETPEARSHPPTP